MGHLFFTHENPRLYYIDSLFGQAPNPAASAEVVEALPCRTWTESAGKYSIIFFSNASSFF